MSRNSWSEPSNIIQATPHSTAPKNVVAVAGEELVRISWDAVNDATEYRVQRLDNSTWKTISIQTSCYYTDKNLNPNQKNIYRVLSLVNKEWGSASDTVTAKPCQAAIEPPQITEVKSGVNKVGIKWRNVTNASKYKVKRRIGTNSNWSVVYIGAKTSYIDQNLLPAQPYYYCVYSYANGEWSRNSNIIKAIPLS